MLKIIFTTCFPWRFSREPQKWSSPILNNQDEPRTCAVTSDKVKFYFRFTSAAQERLLLKVPTVHLDDRLAFPKHNFDYNPDYNCPKLLA